MLARKTGFTPRQFVLAKPGRFSLVIRHTYVSVPVYLWSESKSKNDTPLDLRLIGSTDQGSRKASAKFRAPPLRVYFAARLFCKIQFDEAAASSFVACWAVGWRTYRNLGTRYLAFLLSSAPHDLSLI